MLVELAVKNTNIPVEEGRGVVNRFWNENGKLYRGRYVLIVLLFIIVAATTAFPAWVISEVVNEVFVDQNLQLAYLIAFAVFASFTIRGFATYASENLLGQIANNVVARYQRRIYAHMMNLDVGFYKTNRSAYLVGQINQNIIGVQGLLNDMVIVFAKDFLTLAAMIFVMVYRDPYMSISSLVVLPIIALVVARYVRRVRKVAREQVDLNSRVTSAIVETGQGVEIVKSFTMEDTLSDRMKVLTQNAENRSNRIVQINAKTKPPTEILAGLAIAGVIAFGGYRVAELGHNVGDMISFLAAAMLAYDPARRLASFRVKLERSLVNARMIYELLDIPVQQADKKAAKPLELKKSSLELNDVHFSYTKGETVLDNVSIKVPAGKTIALVGPSGGGKSTIISLVQRFFDPQSGNIQIDGQDIAKVTAESLRANIAYVSQQPMLFEGSIMENIRYGRPDATDEEIIEAAKLAQADEFIRNQPDGYNTQVGELGGNLSGGQRQRLSIARAVLRDAPILLLDEATSALDNKSEAMVQDALEKLMKNRTTIVVAHRLSTIRNADRIFVIDGGKVVEQGSHATLARKNSGVYANLHDIGSDSNASAKKSGRTAKRKA